MRLPLLILSLLALTGSTLGQSKLPQNLHTLEDEALLYWFNEVEGDSIAQERIARVYLERARKEKDTIKMARGYDRLARIFHPEKNIQFADSVIVLTKSMKHITYPALGYMLKGYEWLRLNNLSESTQNFIKAYKIAETQKNTHQLIYLSDRLVSSKAVWGNKHEALKMQKQLDSIISSQNFIEEIRRARRKGVKYPIEKQLLREKIASCQNFAFCYLNLRMLDSSQSYVKKGRSLLKQFNGIEKEQFHTWFATCDIEIWFYKNRFQESIRLIDSIIETDDFWSNDDIMMDLFYFKGFSLINLNNYKKGISFLKKADSIYDKGNVSIQPYDRNLFETLLSHHRNANDLEMQLKYLTKLIQIDSIFKENYQFFEPEMIKTFETPKLLAEKEELIDKLKSKNRMASLSNGAVISLLLLSTFGLYYYFNRQLLYKRRFKELIAYTQNENSELNSQYSNLSKPSNELVENILQSLVVFERNKEYLSQKISLGYLSKRLDTNSKYLSQVINMEKDKSFTQYINDLRVTYAFKKLAADPVFRKYTIKAIAGECGFKTGESFSKAFYKKYGIYPSYYLKSLEKKESPD